MEESLLKTFFELTAIDAPAKHEQKIAEYTVQRLKKLGFNVKQDRRGNVVGTLRGTGKPFLLSAHLDRVLPGKGHIPIKDGDILKSKGKTNLGADNAAGITIILEALEQLVKKKLPHPSLVVIFTVEEELGLRGAAEADNLSSYNIESGIVYDNAGIAGTIVNENPAYVVFTITLRGKAGHPGKDITKAVYLLKVLQDIDWELGETDNGATRVNIGILSAGLAWNIIPGEIKLQGEVRSLQENYLKKKLARIKKNIQSVCKKYKVSFTFEIKKLSSSYRVSENEQLVKLYKQIVTKRKGKFRMAKIFITSDNNIFRAERGIKALTVSTGTENDHTLQEWIRVSDLLMLTKDLISILQLLSDKK